MAILFKVVDFLVSLACHSLKLADMQFEVLVFSLQNLDFIFGMQPLLHILILFRQELLTLYKLFDFFG